ncbi:hypothetical protein [Phormidium tenue]|uniref:Uncharacterized protein n=1 Tax=Phormidium tenue NIES-30 TaxID=549789 RepID=A0A1U7J6Y6_9CYAN|nr:hypothetical protein [Phormidium tenue]MBD2233564.1 hypothetical protein [Phormidium tenue FACHB-1052]OKH48667.1 hypothetical protein NIES30_08975 [Phormidium tenue NIES-30]
MEQQIKEFKDAHEGVSVIKDDYVIKMKSGEHSDWKESEFTRYIVENIRGLEAFQFVLRKEEDFAKLSEVLVKKPELFKDFLAVRYDG